MNKRKTFKVEDSNYVNPNQIFNKTISTANKNQENNYEDNTNNNSEKNNESGNETESFEEDNDENDEQQSKTKNIEPQQLATQTENSSSKKRSFNVDALLAPDNSESKAKKIKSSHDSSFNEDECSNHSFSSN